MSTILPYSYLSQIQTPAASATATPGVTSAVTTASSASGASSSTSSQSLVSQLLGGSAFAPEVLSLLQPSSTGSFNPIATLLNGPTTNNAVSDLYNSLYTSAASAAIGAAKANATPAASSGSGASARTTSPVEALIAAQTQASIAYNQTLQHNAQTAIAANSYAADGVSQLVT